MLIDSAGLKVYGVGQWLEEKPGARSRRNWRKFRLAVDANSGEIIAHKLTDKRALIETAIGRYKASIGRRLRARSFPAQQKEVAIGLHRSQPHAGV